MEAIQEEVGQELDRLVSRVLQDGQRLGHLDLEATEMAIRASMHKVGGVLLEKLLNCDGGGYCGARINCGQGHQAQFVDYRGPRICSQCSPLWRSSGLTTTVRSAKME